MPESDTLKRWVVTAPEGRFIGQHLSGHLMLTPQLHLARKELCADDAWDTRESYLVRNDLLNREEFVVQEITITHALTPPTPTGVIEVSESIIPRIVEMEALIDNIEIGPRTNQIIPALLSQSKAILASARQSLYAAIEISAKTEE